MLGCAVSGCSGVRARARFSAWSRACRRRGSPRVRRLRLGDRRDRRRRGSWVALLPRLRPLQAAEHRRRVARGRAGSAARFPAATRTAALPAMSPQNERAGHVPQPPSAVEVCAHAQGERLPIRIPPASPTMPVRPRPHDTACACGRMHAGGPGAARAPSCPRTSAAAPALFKNGRDDVAVWFRGGWRDAHDLLEPAAARTSDDTRSFQPRQTTLVGAGVARTHHGLEARYRPVAIRDQDGFAVSHSIEQRAQPVLRLGDRGRLHEAIIAFSDREGLLRIGFPYRYHYGRGISLELNRPISALTNASASSTGNG